MLLQWFFILCSFLLFSKNYTIKSISVFHICFCYFFLLGFFFFIFKYFSFTLIIRYFIVILYRFYIISLNGDFSCPPFFFNFFFSMSVYQFTGVFLCSFFSSFRYQNPFFRFSVISCFILFFIFNILVYFSLFSFSTFILYRFLINAINDENYISQYKKTNIS